MRSSPAIALIALLLGGSLALTAADSDSGGTLSKADNKFLHHAAEGNLLEIKTSELALKRGLAGDEKTFAQKMIDDHTQVDTELRTLAQSKGITLSTTPDDKVQKKLEKLGKQNDKDFAEAYFECQVEAHKDAVSAYKDATEGAKDTDVKAFAAKHLPHLQGHLDEAQALEKRH
jgi:putative membrane protein